MNTSRRECQYLDRPSELPATYGWCADMHGCEGIDCPLRESFADRPRADPFYPWGASLWLPPLA